MAAKQIVTVTLNPALDLTVELDKLVPGEVNLAAKGHLYPAGKGINVAMVLDDLGEQVSVSGILGEDNRQLFDKLFAERKFANHFRYERGATRINVKLSEASDRITDINLPGLSVQQETLQSLYDSLDQLCQQAELFVVSGSMPRGLSPAVYGQLTGMLKSKGRQVIVDTSGAALQAAVEALPNVIKPNVEELEQWAGRRLAELPEQEAVVRELLQKGIQHVVISDGAKGVRWYNQDGAWQALPPKVDVVSTVGAGDSLVAGLSYGFANRLAVPDTLIVATAVAALAVSQVGVGINSVRKFNELKQKVTVKPLVFSI